MAVNEVVVTSDMAAAMGATVRLAGPALGMYLVFGSGQSPESLVRTAGGKVVLRLNGFKMLVTLPFAGYLLLRNNRNIANIGPVTVDLKRLARVAEMMVKVNGNGNPG